MAKLELAPLLEAGVHFGHKAHRWNPKMFPYIYTERNGVHILDLIQTAKLLNKACDFVQDASKKGKKQQSPHRLPRQCLGKTKTCC